MQTLQFPMTLTHRSNPHAQVVVANADQLAEIPAEYLPDTIAGVPAVVTAAAAVPGVNLDAGTVDSAEDAERRQSLAEAVDEFTAHVQAETAKIDASHQQLAAARATLEQHVAALNEQQEQLDRERAEFEALRAEGAAPGDDAAAGAAPTKRTRK